MLLAIIGNNNKILICDRMDMEKLDMVDLDQYGIEKIFHDASTPKAYVFRLGIWDQDGENRDHFRGRTYGRCSDSYRNDPRKSVVSTE